MNNFIVGQVTPDMLTGMTYGTYIFFGLFTFGGAAFIWFFFPETKGLSLEVSTVQMLDVTQLLTSRTGNGRSLRLCRCRRG